MTGERIGPNMISVVPQLVTAEKTVPQKKYVKNRALSTSRVALPNNQRAAHLTVMSRVQRSRSQSQSQHVGVVDGNEVKLNSEHELITF
jgi:hypothetical protein